jgi:hypothetical protein
MHILDLLMFIVFIIIITKILGEEYSSELGLVVYLIFTAVYCILFIWIDYNWIDIFRWVYALGITL